MTLSRRSQARVLIASALPLLVLVAACSSSKNPASPTTTSSGPYSQTDLVVGTGTVAAVGNTLTVNYAGWLYDTSRPDGKGTQFNPPASYSFVLGAGTVIRGWDQGVAGMRVGGQRRLVIPPALAYGSSSPGAGIPPNATLVFDIALLAVQ